MVLAHRAGAELADLEFLQFHPTAVTGVPRPRGLPRHRGDPRRGRDAPRPGRRALRRGARAARRGRARDLRASCQRTGADHVGLDMRHVDPALFPNVVGALRESGLDPARELIPVSPAAHYMMGGDRHRPARALDGARAAGRRRVGVHGLHGANRLASNSLSECFVFGARGRAGRARRARRRRRGDPPAPRPVAPPSRETRDAHVAARGPRAHARRARSPARRPASRSPGSSRPARCMREESRGAHRRDRLPGY